MSEKEVLSKLDSEGLRLAGSNESGWNWVYISDKSQRITLWVTEK